MDKIIVPNEVIMSKILLIRDHKVMIDRDLAELYGVTTKRLNEQVKRNINRFPENFMFQLTKIEKKLANQNKNIELVFSYLDELIEKQDNKIEREKIGYKK